jgi:5,10-methylenetetrahydromethanopterin reductase
MSMSPRLGVQIAPWRPSDEIVAVGEKLREVVDVVWVQDQMLARNVYVLLSALAHAGCGVGTNVTYPIGRNPLEMASAIATIAELVHDDKDLQVGIGTGGALVTSLFDKEKGVTSVRETIELMRALWSGETVPLDDYPTLGARLSYRAGATAQLTYPVERTPGIMVAGVKPQILRAAAELADGIICPSNMPSFSIAALTSDRFGEISGLDAVVAARPPDAPPLRLNYGINLSVSQDREQARVYARRQAALIVGNAHLAPDFEAIGIDAGTTAPIKAAFQEGLGVDGAAARMSDELTDALIIAGTPEECVGRMVELRELAVQNGFTEFYVGAPLGPDLAEAAEILAAEVIPAVWPERVAGAA